MNFSESTRIKEYFDDIFCCPACHGNLHVTSPKSIACHNCNRDYTISDGIPDLRFFPNKESFDAKQALYEADLHDKEAEMDYEERVVLAFGQKTNLMAHRWVREVRGRILDFGSGTGQLSRVLCKYHKQVFAFDISLKSLKKNISENNVIGVLANAFHLPFKDNAFDTVCINGVLHHIVNYHFVVKEIGRITKKTVFVSEGCSPKYHITREQCGMSVDVVMRRIVKEYVRIWRYLQRSKTKSLFGGSKFEKLIDTDEIKEYLVQNGFGIDYCKFWTNLDYRSRFGLLKKSLTKLLVSKKGGTHFDIKATKRLPPDDL